MSEQLLMGAVKLSSHLMEKTVSMKGEVMLKHAFADYTWMPLRRYAERESFWVISSQRSCCAHTESHVVPMPGPVCQTMLVGCAGKKEGATQTVRVCFLFFFKVIMSKIFSLFSGDWAHWWKPLHLQYYGLDFGCSLCIKLLFFRSVSKQ